MLKTPIMAIHWSDSLGFGTRGALQRTTEKWKNHFVSEHKQRGNGAQPFRTHDVATGARDLRHESFGAGLSQVVGRLAGRIGLIPKQLANPAGDGWQLF
jgi:hypothetical protein